MRDRVKSGAPDGSSEGPSLTLAQHLARAFHDPAERHQRWTRCLARTADEARLQVIARRRAGRGGFGNQAANELDAAARRVGLVAQDAIRRAIVEAQTARDTHREIFVTHRG